MKHLRTSIVALVAVSVLAFVAIVGCQSTPVVVKPATTNYVEEVRTNYTSVTNYVTNVVEIVAASTNATTGEVTPAIVQPHILPAITFAPTYTTNISEIRTPPLIYTNLSLAPWVPATTQVVAEASGVPWATSAAGLITTGIAGVMAWINRKRQLEAEGKALTWQTATEVVVQNVEHMRQAAQEIPGYTTEIDTKLVRAMEAAQRAAGVKQVIAGVVDVKTDRTLTDAFLAKANAK